MILRLIFRVVLLLVLSLKLSAQSYDFRHYQVEQGLSYNTVFHILQDSRGFMWFASKDGLNRFDGYNFKIFRNNPTDTTSLGSNVIISMFEDKAQKLWVGTSKGLYLYNDSLENFSIIGATRDNYINEIKGDELGNLYFIMAAKLFKIDTNTSKAQPFIKQQDFNCYSMVFDHTGALWTASSDGTLKHFDAVSKTFKSFSLFEHSKPVSSRWIDRIFLTRDGSILVGTSHQGVKLFNVKSKSYRDILTYNPDGTVIFAKNFLHYEGDVYWIATESGVFVYNLRTGDYEHLVKDQRNPYALSDNAVYGLAKDSEGGVWLGTYFGGVNYYPKPFTAFEKYFPTSRKFPLSGNAVREITKDQYGNTWIGTEDAGLNKLDSQTGKITKFLPEKSSAGISHTNIHGLLAVGNEIWVGTFEQGLDRIDIKTGRVIKHYDIGSSEYDLKSAFIECIIQNKLGEILIGTSFGVYKYEKKYDGFLLLKEFPQDVHYVSLKEDNDGTIWAGAINRGLFFHNPLTGKSGGFIHNAANLNSLSSNFINSLFFDRQHNLWITTEYGLNQFDRKSGTFKRYMATDGFPSNVFYRVEQDTKGALWISTAKGLVNFNPNTKYLKTYTKSNGLLSDQFNYNSSFNDGNGKLYFGSVNGLIAFNPSLFQINKVLPRVYVTGFQVFNDDLEINPNSPLKESISQTKNITLAFDQSTFSIDFAALVYTDFETSGYAYMLEGVDKDYTYLKRNRKVFYTKLAPGRYTFLVKGANSSGLWSKEPTKLTIQINPPFWKTTWAYSLYVILVTTMAYIAFSYYDRSAKLKHKRKLEAIEHQKEREVYQAKVESFTHLITIAQSQPDQDLLNQLNDYIHDNLSNSALDVDFLADKLNMSRATFYRKVKAISNLTPNELINITRLKKAAELLVNTDMKIQQIAAITGFTSQAQFSRSFTKQFGVTPSEYGKTDPTVE